MKYIYIILIYLFVSCDTPPSKFEVNDVLTYEQEINDLRNHSREFMLGVKSPLKKEDRKKFVSLNFFAPDSNYRVMAKFQTLLNGETFKMKTNTDREPAYQKYALLEFKLGGQNLSLTAYKALEYKSDELFIPFNDLTNGKESYASGRFLDVHIPKGSFIELDFNKAYNPYCAYNSDYSCPIPPSENSLNMRIEAGEKKYKNDH